MMNMASNTECNDRALFEVKVPLNICVPIFLLSLKKKAVYATFKTDTYNVQSMHSLYVYSGNTPLFKAKNSVCRDLPCLTA